MPRTPHARRKEDDWKTGLVVLGHRVFDSNYAAFVAGGLFFLGFLWIALRPLDSRDLLELYKTVRVPFGWGIVGWLVALAEIPIAQWAVGRLKSDAERENAHLIKESEKARGELLKYKQQNLQLGLDSLESESEP